MTIERHCDACAQIWQRQLRSLGVALTAVNAVDDVPSLNADDGPTLNRRDTPSRNHGDD